MPQCPTTHISEPREWFLCLVTNCSSKFWSMHGCTRHFRAKYTLDESQNDLEDFYMVSASWSKSPSPQSESMDENSLSQTQDDFELPVADIESSPTTNTWLIETNDFQSLEELPKNFSASPLASFHSTSPYYQDKEKSIPSSTDYHPSINGK